jgi:glycosyltransferase involved in cell wall biosynthesis
MITAIHLHCDMASGSAQLAFDEAKFLAEKGHEVWLVAPAVDMWVPEMPKMPEHEVRDGVHLLRYRFPVRGALDPRKIWQHRVEMRKTIKRYCPASFDVVHGHSAIQHQAALDMGFDAEICYSIHSPMTDELRLLWQQQGNIGRLRGWVGLPIAKRVERSCLARSKRVTAFSEFTKNALSSYHGGLAEKIKVIPGWSGMDRFQILPDRQAAKAQFGWRTDVPVFFTLRRLVSRMGLDRLVEAAGLIAQRGYKFQIVIGGTGNMRAQLEQLVRSGSLQEYVKFIGYVPDADLPVMYGACDAFVLPTTELECFGIIAVEALSAGRPVLATPVAAIPEMIEKIEPKWLSRNAGVDGIAELLLDFLNNRLPAHSPEVLRDFIARSYDREVVLPRFCDYILNGCTQVESAQTS